MGACLKRCQEGYPIRWSSHKVCLPYSTLVKLSLVGLLEQLRVSEHVQSRGSHYLRGLVTNAHSNTGGAAPLVSTDVNRSRAKAMLMGGTHQLTSPTSGLPPTLMAGMAEG